MQTLDEDVVGPASQHSADEWRKHGHPPVVVVCGPHAISVCHGSEHARAKVTRGVDGVACGVGNENNNNNQEKKKMRKNGKNF